jgi:hypothetical protein
MSSFEQAREVTRLWLADNCVAATLLGTGREDADYWLVEWECDPELIPDGLPVMLVSKCKGKPVEFFPQADYSIFSRIDAMTLVDACHNP